MLTDPSKREERASFRQLLDYVRKNADALSGVLFYKVDRAARNLFDCSIPFRRLRLQYTGVCKVCEAKENYECEVRAQERRQEQHYALQRKQMRIAEIRECLGRI